MRDTPTRARTTTLRPARVSTFLLVQEPAARHFAVLDPSDSTPLEMIGALIRESRSRTAARWSTRKLRVARGLPPRKDWERAA